jgi:ribosomal protein L29
MKRKDYADLKGKTVAELTKLASTKRTDAIKKKMQTLAGKEKNLKVYRNLRVEIAKILTLIREKEILEKVESEKAKKEEQK